MAGGFFTTPPDARRLNLVFFPQAASGGGSVLRWQGQLDEHAVVHVVQMPAHGARYLEPSYRSMRPLVNDLLDSDTRFCGTRYAFVGARLGAWVAIELLQALAARGAAMPSAFLVCGAPGPHDKSLFCAGPAELGPVDIHVTKGIPAARGI
ncbi:hypothetical protein D3093_34130 (plasmid) [Azospirillum argentinense]|uniref:Thioesterase domain-containing protein n=1 Tax=Azospirillum argentinense TaxID=2970906 RepID=A0A4D8Q1P0_9PROT|nr:hypothetical protein [Azospirillum argentinense]QCO00272.1 hypothetical protein D3093_34130 [Azospirillum argentinense]